MPRRISSPSGDATKPPHDLARHQLLRRLPARRCRRLNHHAGNRPDCCSSNHIASSRFWICRVGIILRDGEPRMRAPDHRDRQQCRGLVPERDLPRRKPQVALRRVPSQPGQPIRGINQPVSRPQPPDVLAESGERTPPVDPLGGHVQRRGHQLPHRRLERRERCRHRRPLVLWRAVGGHRSRQRRPPDAKVPRDLTLRNTVRHQPPDQSAILDRDHAPDLSPPRSARGVRRRSRYASQGRARGSATPTGSAGSRWESAS